MKPTVHAIAIAVAIVVVAGCGDTSSPSGSDTERGAGPAADRVGKVIDPGVSAPQARRGRGADRAKTTAEPSGKAESAGEAARVPLGVPLNAREPRVRRAIAQLLHPPRAGDRGGGPNGDDQQNQGR